MAKEVVALRKLPRGKLLERKAEVEFTLIGCHGGTRPVAPLGKRKGLRKSIARINTLLKEVTK